MAGTKEHHLWEAPRRGGSVLDAELFVMVVF